MPFTPAAVLLDLDGTLIDTERFYQRIWQATAADFQIDLNDAVYQQFIGIRLTDCFQLIKTLGGNGFDLAVFKEHLAARETEGWNTGIDCKPGSRELLHFLHERQIPMALVTSAHQAKIDRVMAHYPWSDYFQGIVSGEMITRPKPAPDAYQLAAKQLGITPSACLALEDSNTGMRSALTAGCHSIMIPDLNTPDSDVREKASKILPDLFSVIDYLSN
ncbi:HAD family hydrolase [Kistimonas asteriae]|uniref:HAD family hydrolase n=1 Tax=Kistimonas asteriae TaxID=517724 RepID=UPI001BA53A38|nr:HAD family phosphatase [Kistimonas asteriae]